MKILTLGKQEFSKIINNNCIYVDKTKIIYKLITTGDTYFISRPGRFEELIKKIYEKYGSVAILVDEYDKPIIDYIDDLDQADENRDILNKLLFMPKIYG